MLTLDPNLKLFDICYCAALEVPRSAFLLLFVLSFFIYVPCIVFCSFYFYFNFFIIFLLCIEHNTVSQCGRYFFFFILLCVFKHRNLLAHSPLISFLMGL